MNEIILSDDQLRVVREASGRVAILDPQGCLVGYLSRAVDPAIIAEAERRAASDGPWFTTQQVLDHLKSLDADHKS